MECACDSDGDPSKVEQRTSRDWAVGLRPCGLHYVALALAREEAFARGMVVGAAIIAWAEVVRANAPRLIERSYWTAENCKDYYDCGCPGCGVLMKNREAGVDEGTDNEWCGLCRG